MHPMGNPRDHFWLTIGMSKAVGADLGDAMRDDRISHQTYAQIINRCRSCDDPEGCKLWLETHAKAKAAPDYCRNRDVLADLSV